MTSANLYTIVGFFPTRAEAETAVTELIRAGYSREEISVVASQKRDARSEHTPNVGPIESTGSLEDTGEKAAIGGMAGFIIGIVALAIPGIGPLIAAGPLAAALTGAAAGAATGGLIGAFTDDGVPEESAERYTKAIREGKIMVSLHADEEHAEEAADILEDAGAIEVGDPADFPPPQQTQPRPIGTITPEGIAAARLETGSGVRDRQRARTRVNIHPGITGAGLMHR